MAGVLGEVGGQGGGRGLRHVRWITTCKEHQRYESISQRSRTHNTENLLILGWLEAQAGDGVVTTLHITVNP